MDIDGKWLISSSDDYWGDPDEAFLTKEAALAAASEDGSLYVGRAREATPARLFDRSVVERMLEQVDEDGFENWRAQESDQLLSWSPEQVDELTEALVAAVAKAGIVNSWFVVEEIERVDRAGVA